MACTPRSQKGLICLYGECHPRVACLAARRDVLVATTASLVGSMAQPVVCSAFKLQHEARFSLMHHTCSRPTQCLILVLLLALVTVPTSRKRPHSVDAFLICTSVLQIALVREMVSSGTHVGTVLVRHRSTMLSRSHDLAQTCLLYTSPSPRD